MMYVELVLLVLLGSGGFYLLLNFIVDHIQSRRLVRTLKNEAILDWAANFAVRAAENYGRAREFSGPERFSKAVEMARARLLECGLEPPDDHLKQTIGSAYEKLRPTLQRSEGASRDST